MKRDCYNVFDKNWYNYNDSHVSEISRVKEVSSSAYVLFYVKQSEVRNIEKRLLNK